MTDAVLERAFDDVLLTADEIRTGAPGAGSRAADLVVESMQEPLLKWIKRNRQQQRGATAGAQIVATAAAEPLATHMLLAAGVLLWATEQTGVPMAEILTGVRTTLEG